MQQTHGPDVRIEIETKTHTKQNVRGMTVVRNARIADEGEDGLYKAESSDYDAVVLDVMLPKLDGWEVLKRLRQMYEAGGWVLVESAIA